MDTLLSQGQNKESLINYLEEVNNTLSIDNVYQQAEEYEIRIVYRKGKLCWKACLENGMKNIPLSEVLERFADEKEFVPDSSDIEVWSYQKAKTEKKIFRKRSESPMLKNSVFPIRGKQDSFLPEKKRRESRINKNLIEKVETIWTVVEPFWTNPADGYEKRSFFIHEEDMHMLATGVAIKSNGKLYLVDKSAMTSIARYMECSTMCCKYGDNTIGLAIQMAQAFENKKGFKIVVSNYKDRNYGVILGIVGDSYHLFSVRSFFKELFDFMSKSGVWNVRKWEASVSGVSAELEWVCPENTFVTTGISVRATEVGEGYQIYPYIRKENVYFYLSELKLSHRKPFCDELQLVLESLKNNVKEFPNLLKKLSKPFDIKYEDEIMKNLMRFRNANVYRKAQLGPANRSDDYFTFFQSLLENVNNDGKDVKYVSARRLAAGNAAKVIPLANH